MAANHESVMWTVLRVSRTTGKRAVYVFRTRERAREFVAVQNLRSKVSIYYTPERAQWGPE